MLEGTGPILLLIVAGLLFGVLWRFDRAIEDQGTDEGPEGGQDRIVTQVAAMLQSAALAFFAFTGLMTVWHLMVLGAVQAVINAFDMPARQSFLRQMIEDRSDLPNAIALNSSMVNASRIIGPSVGGLVIEPLHSHHTVREADHRQPSGAGMPAMEHEQAVALVQRGSHRPTAHDRHAQPAHVALPKSPWSPDHGRE